MCVSKNKILAWYKAVLKQNFLQQTCNWREKFPKSIWLKLMKNHLRVDVQSSESTYTNRGVAVVVLQGASSFNESENSVVVWKVVGGDWTMKDFTLQGLYIGGLKLIMELLDEKCNSKDQWGKCFDGYGGKRFNCWGVDKFHVTSSINLRTSYNLWWTHELC